MIDIRKFMCAIAIILSGIACADTTAIEKKTFQGKSADEEIGTFLEERWGRQIWQIEYRAASDSGESSLWHVKGSPYWVRLVSDEHNKQNSNLKDLDTTQSYEFAGTPVDLNYGTITFFVEGRIEKIVKPKKTKKQNKAEEPTPRKPSD